MADAFDEWRSFDPIEYVTRNYGKILPEDRAIIEVVIDGIKDLDFTGVELAADVGAGPNFYPAMLLSSLVKPRGEIDLIEFAKPNRDFVDTLLNSSTGIYHNTNKVGKAQSFDTRKVWQKFDELIADLGKEGRFQNTFRKARAATKSMAGSIYDLPESKYDFVSSYFVAESITASKGECVRALESLLRSVRPGGGFMVALMIGSEGYPAGEATHFPAVTLSIEQTRAIFDSIPSISSRLTPITDKQEKARVGYHGMAIVMGRRTFA